jgi:hypothetical protein
MSEKMSAEDFYEAIHKHVDTPLIESAKATGDGECALFQKLTELCMDCYSRGKMEAEKRIWEAARKIKWREWTEGPEYTLKQIIFGGGEHDN